MSILTKFEALTCHQLQHDVYLARPERAPEVLHTDDPAFKGMFDFNFLHAIVAMSETNLPRAREIFEVGNIHILPVIDNARRFIGLVGMADVIGDRPIKVASDLGVPVNDLTVNDIMTRSRDLIVLHWEDVEVATIGNIITTMNARPLRYAVVLSTPDDDGVRCVRGIFTRHHLSKHIGEDIGEDVVAAKTIAELKKHLD